MTSYKEKLALITTFVFDVDGVLTTGEVLLLDRDIVRTFNSKDAYALQYASKMGYRILFITGGDSRAVKIRLESLGATEVCLSSKNKLHVYDTLKEKYEFEDKEALYMGDDIPDYHVMRRVGVSACPQDASPEIKHISDYQSPYNGGKNCVRDIIEQTLRLQEKWFKEDAFEW